LEVSARKYRQTQIFIETPFRNNQLLEEVIKSCRPDTQLCIACNLTAHDELIKTQPVSQWKKDTPDLHKKPAIFLIF
ncbi:tetrapyrrole methylase, partial [Klebsiella pneumoniae]|nr:tetrapyrrole methylase [Klebsiella pneumoniae]